jgi:hypothetical protein
MCSAALYCVVWGRQVEVIKYGAMDRDHLTDSSCPVPRPSARSLRRSPRSRKLHHTRPTFHIGNVLHATFHVPMNHARSNPSAPSCASRRDASADPGGWIVMEGELGEVGEGMVQLR